MSDLLRRLREQRITNWVHSPGDTPRADGVKANPLCVEAAEMIEHLTSVIVGLENEFHATEIKRLKAESLRASESLFAALQVKRTGPHWEDT